MESKCDCEADWPGEDCTMVMLVRESKRKMMRLKRVSGTLGWLCNNQFTTIDVDIQGQAYVGKLATINYYRGTVGSPLRRVQ